MCTALLGTHCSEDHGESGGAGDDKRQQAEAVSQDLCVVLCNKKKKKKSKIVPSCIKKIKMETFFLKCPLRRCARTCRVACISLRPPRGLSTGSRAGPVRRKPATAVSVHTARRCCLLRPLIILRLLSVENTQGRTDAQASFKRCSRRRSFDYLPLKKRLS